MQRRARRCSRLAAVLAFGVWLPALAAPVEVKIKGVEGEPLDNVRKMLSIVAAEPEDTERPPAVRRLHRMATDEIRRALRPYGYYDPTVRARLERTDEGWRASYRIEPGPRVKVVEVRIDVRGDGADDPAFAELRESLDLRAGEPLLHAEYDTARQRLLELAEERGYFDAQWATRTLRIDPGAQEARAVLELDTGPRYRFGEVKFGDAALGPDLLRRYLPFEPGEPYLDERLRALRYALDDSGYFSRVEVRAERDQRDAGRVPVRVTLEMRPQNRYTYGVGFGTDTGARAVAGWENRYVNRGGHSLETRVEVSAIGNRVSARYKIPLGEPARERMVFDAELASEEIGDGDTREYSLAASRVAQRGRFQNTLSIELQRTADDISGEENTRDLVIPGAGLVYSRFDDPVYARRGLRLRLQVDGGSATLGSDTSFLRTRISGEGVHALWPGGRLLTRGELGTAEVADFQELPLSQRFFAGGDNSVRGFDFQSLGPTDDDGNVVGGRHLAVASVEIEQLIRGNWGAAAFVDTGNAMDDVDVDLRTAAGVGLRYRSPVGMFRVDIAKAIDGDEAPRLHLSLGVNL